MSVHPWGRFRAVVGRRFALAAAIVIVACSPSFAATILLNDTWADGSRTETNLPNESAVYASVAGAVTMGTGSLAYTQDTSSRRLHTYFAPDGSPATLNVGDKLITTIEFTSGTLDNSTGRNFRVGLFSTPAAHVTVDSTNDSGGAGNPWQSASGYAANFFLTSAPGTTQLFQIGKRTNIGGGNLLGSTGDYAQNATGGGVVAAASNTDYTLTIELSRTAVDEMDVTYTLADATGVLATQTATDTATMFGSAANATLPYTAFDMIAFRFSSTAGVSDVVTFKRFQVEHVAIPEPAAIVLLGLGVAIAGSSRCRFV